MQDTITPNFKTATDCKAFRLTSQMLEQVLNTAKAEGREYSWMPLEIDYWLPEKADFDYERACPNFTVVLSPHPINNSLTLDIINLFESYQGYKNCLAHFVKVF